MATSLRPSLPAAPASTTGVILAIDYGQKRLGLAVSDEHQLVSRPYATWTRTNRRRDLARLKELVRQIGICKIVVGLPLHLDGSPSEMSDEAKRFAARVAKALGLPVEMMDERLSSWEAHETMSDVRPTKGSGRRAVARAAAGQPPPLDKIAAAIILRDYLAQTRARDGSRA